MQVPFCNLLHIHTLELCYTLHATEQHRAEKDGQRHITDEHCLCQQQFDMTSDSDCQSESRGAEGIVRLHRISVLIVVTRQQGISLA